MTVGKLTTKFWMMWWSKASCVTGPVGGWTATWTEGLRQFINIGIICETGLRRDTSSVVTCYENPFYSNLVSLRRGNKDVYQSPYLFFWSCLVSIVITNSNLHHIWLCQWGTIDIRSHFLNFVFIFLVVLC